MSAGLRSVSCRQRLIGRRGDAHLEQVGKTPHVNTSLRLLIIHFQKTNKQTKTHYYLILKKKTMQVISDSPFKVFNVDRYLFYVLCSFTIAFLLRQRLLENYEKSEGKV